MNQDPHHTADVSHRLAERLKELTALRQVVEILADRSASTGDLLSRRLEISTVLAVSARCSASKDNVRVRTTGSSPSVGSSSRSTPGRWASARISCSRRLSPFDSVPTLRSRCSLNSSLR